MLKIKDGIDLKELEKFGFQKIIKKGKRWSSEYGESKDSTSDLYENIEWHFDCYDNGIEIHQERKNNDWCYPFDIKELHIWNECERPVCENVFNVLFDLIQAGLIEKVGEIKNDNTL